MTPVALPLLLAQALAGERVPDFVSPLVDAVYGPRRAARARRPQSPEPIDVGAVDPVAEGRG
jgi:hypothetical protein